MRRKRIKSTASFSWIAIVAILVLLYLSYFLLYIPRQEKLVQERGFRILEKYAENIKNKSDYFKNHLENYSPFYFIKPFRDSLSLAFDFSGKDHKTISSNDSVNIVKLFDNLFPEIELDTAEWDEQNPDPYYDPGGQGKSFVFRIDKKEFDKEVGYKINRDKIDTFHKAKIPVPTLMRNLQFDRLFENIALLDSGQVIHNSNGSLVHDITNFEAMKKDTVSKKQGGVFYSLVIKGKKSHVLILPFIFLDKEFYVAGFIPDVDYKKKTRSINNQFLTVVSGIILLLLVGMPILKIVFISRKERLNADDAHFASLSLVFGTGLLMLLFIGTTKHYIVDRLGAETRIRALSKELNQNIEDDFDELFRLGNTVVCDTCEGFHSVVKNILKDDSTKYKTLDDSVYESQFPFNEILFMSDEGKVVKAATTTPFSDLVTLDLSSRNYYRNLKKMETCWPEKSELFKGFEGYFIESIKSYNTGATETSVSFRLKRKIEVDTASRDSVRFMAITSHVPALYDQVLPEDVAYVIIDNKGEVLFHSNDKKILQENFLVETNNNPHLRGAIGYRTEETVRVIYNERPWMARIVPMKNKLFFHITLIDLKFTDSKNTRIYLFSFYFVLFTMLFILAGVLIFQHTGPEKRFMKDNTWTFRWLMYDDGRKTDYRQLLFVQTVIVLCQLLGLLIVKKPFAMLFYQLVFVAFSGFAAYFVLVKKLTFTGSMTWLLAGVAAPLLILAILNFKGLIIALALVIVLGVLTGLMKKNILHRFIPARPDVRQTYYAYMLVWLVALSVVPVVGYYESIKLQEEIISKKNRMMYMAHSNLQSRNKNSEPYKARWYERIDGGDTDSLEISFLDDSFVITDTAKPTCVDSIFNGQKADLLYNLLPSPITGDDYLMAMMDRKNRNLEWLFTDSLFYSTTATRGVVKVKSGYLEKLLHRPGVVTSGVNQMNVFHWSAFLALPLIVLVVFVWSVFRYLADIVLGGITAHWKKPKKPDWQSIAENKGINRVLLISFDHDQFLSEVKSRDLGEEIKAEKLLSVYSEVEDLVEDKEKDHWVSGLGACLPDFRKADLICSKLNELDRLIEGKIVVQMPYDIDFIREYFDEYLVEFDDEKEEKRIHRYLDRLMHLFSGYYRYTGAVDKVAINELFTKLESKSVISDDEEVRTLAQAHLMKLRYRHIWNNLGRMERMILFDLADDEMLNFKNRFLINRLQLKGLIEFEHYPKIFTPSFQYFLKHSIDPDETMELEKHLSRQGKWKNAKYMLLLLLVPLAAFMFISQGASIEKVIGILAGVLALFSGVARLIDSSWLAGISKQ